MTHTAHRESFEKLVDVYAPVGQIATGFTFTEGPLWHPRDNFLLFSDIPGDVRHRWDAKGGIREVMRPSNKCNGMTYDGSLNLLVCEHATSSLIREFPDGRREVMASHFEGSELNSPNDVCVRSDGSIYFSDPWYGRMPGFGVERPRPLGFQGIYRVRPGGAPQLLVDRTLFDQPNGLCFSPDEKLLYVNDTVQALIRAFPVYDNGTLGPGRVFASGISSELVAGRPDGMKCDAEGNVWVTGPGGVHVFAPDGTLLGQLRIPETTANLAWGGADFRTLFITATHSVYTVPTRVGPRLEPYMRTTPSGNSTESPTIMNNNGLTIQPGRAALLIQDMQNDVISEGGAFASSGAPQHAASQNVVSNVIRLAEACRSFGIPVIHVWFVVEPGAPGLTLNAPLFEGIVDANALVRGTWGAAPVAGLEPMPGDFVVEKMRMSAWEGSRLETILKALGRDLLINTGAWTNMSVEHTARTGADKGYFVVVPQDCCSTMNSAWQASSIDHAMRNVAVVTDCAELLAAITASLSVIASR